MRTKHECRSSRCGTVARGDHCARRAGEAMRVHASILYKDYYTMGSCPLLHYHNCQLKQDICLPECLTTYLINKKTQHNNGVDDNTIQTLSYKTELTWTTINVRNCTIASVQKRGNVHPRQQHRWSATRNQLTPTSGIEGYLRGSTDISGREWSNSRCQQHSLVSSQRQRRGDIYLSYYHIHAIQRRTRTLFNPLHRVQH